MENGCREAERLRKQLTWRVEEGPMLKQGLTDTRGPNTESQQHTEIHMSTLESAALLSGPHGTRRDTDTACRQRLKKEGQRRKVSKGIYGDIMGGIRQGDMWAGVQGADAKTV